MKTETVASVGLTPKEYFCFLQWSSWPRNLAEARFKWFSFSSPLNRQHQSLEIQHDPSLLGLGLPRTNRRLFIISMFLTQLLNWWNRFNFRSKAGHLDQIAFSITSIHEGQTADNLFFTSLKQVLIFSVSNRRKVRIHRSSSDTLAQRSAEKTDNANVIRVSMCSDQRKTALGLHAVITNEHFRSQKKACYR